MFKNFIASIREEKEGFSFYKPWRHDEKSMSVIVPIIRESKRKRDYITFAEALTDFSVVETGEVGYVLAKNDSEKPVLITRGEIFAGKTQERAAIHSHIVMPHSSLRVAVRCIHRSQGLSCSVYMSYGGKIPYDIDLSNQHKTWGSVTTYCSTFNISDDVTNKNNSIDNLNITLGNSYIVDNIYHNPFGDIIWHDPMPIIDGINAYGYSRNNEPKDNLYDTMKDMSNMMKTALEKMPYIDNQVGVVFLKGNDLLGLEVYDLKDSWEAVKKEVIEKEGSNILEEYSEDIFEFKQDKIKSFLKRKLNINFNEKIVHEGKYKVVSLISDSVLGEGTILNGKVIHLSLWKK
jgi:hypothetical protein